MKTLVNCTPTEFLKQTARIRAPFMKWLEETGIPEIRARKPEGYDDMTLAQKREAMSEQASVNMGDMLNACMEKDPDGTLEIMALCCFTEPEDIDEHPMTDYLNAVLEMIGNEAVRSFFMLYLKQSPRNTSKD